MTAAERRRAAMIRVVGTCDAVSSVLRTVCHTSRCKFLLVVIDEDAEPGDRRVPSSLASTIPPTQIVGFLRSLAGALEERDDETEGAHP